ncbi:MAG TPA: tetratricopeptide repeat protein [Candidatus Tyrphobacter sp.]
MKRFLLPLILLAAIVVAVTGTTSHAVARRSSATPTPSPTPAPLPTATPEPPSIAIPRLQARIRANPNDQEAMTELAGQYLSINRPELALPLSQRLLHDGDKSAQVYFIDGYAQQALGQIPSAINDLEQASTIDPTNVTVLGNLAQLYLAVNRPADAERIANRAVTFNATSPQAFLSLGSVYAAQSHYGDARIQLEKAFALDKTDTRPLFSIAQTYVAQNNISLALQTIERVLVVDPKNVDALAFKADLYARQHDDVHAAEAYDDAAVAAPTDEQKVAIYVRKAQYFVSEHKNAQAEAVYQDLLTRYPNVALTYVAYGAYLAATQHLVEQGVVQWRKALSIDPDNEDALRDMGQYELQHNRISDAIVYLKHLVSVTPSAAGYELLAQAYNSQHQYAAQRDACSRSFAIKRSPDTLACIAGADFEMRNYREAGQIFDVLDNAARGYLDQNPQLLYIAARTYAGLHQRDKAISAYKRLLPLMRRGSPAYKTVQRAIADLNRNH